MIDRGESILVNCLCAMGLKKEDATMFTVLVLT